MNKTEQKIRIAVACGMERKKMGFTHGLQTQFPPDYLNDLNAMREAEKILTDEQWHEYYRFLYIITRPVEHQPQPGCDNHTKSFIHVSAAQKAEAFLKTLNLWDEDK